MEAINLISQTSSIIIILLISFCFLIVGIFYSKNFLDLRNYLVANRSVKTFSLTMSLVASALGTWILFGPASAATWGGIGAVIGYALGTAFPFFVLIYLGKTFRYNYPKAKTLIEVINLHYGKKLYKVIFILSIFYMTIFLIAEVTAVSLLVKYLSGNDLWVTSLIVILCSMTYTLYGGLRISIFTDKIQFILLSLLLFITFSYLFSIIPNNFNFNFIKQNRPELLSLNYINNFTAGLTFFIAVAATNLFHQGNWQRVYAAKNNKVLKESLVFSFLIVIPIVFIMGFIGLVAISTYSDINPDLAFFYLLLQKQNLYISGILIILAISLTISSIDTIINAISSLIIVDSKNIFNLKLSSIKFSNVFIIILCLITFVVSSKGFSILYLFLLADLFCCSAVFSIFYGFYNKNINEKKIIIAITFGLIGGLLFFPNPNFSQSFLVGYIVPTIYFPKFINESLLFCSFIVATFLPAFILKIKKKL